MADGSVLTMFYTSTPAEDLVGRTIDTCSELGFDTGNPSELVPDQSEDNVQDIEISYNGLPISLRFHLSDDREPKQPAASIIALSHLTDPSRVKDREEYRHRMNVVFEFICRLSIALKADYVAMADTEGRASEVVPMGRPIGDVLDTVPRFGVYSPAVIDDFGGLDAMYDKPWYTAELESGQTAVIESASPWSEGGWEPPMDAPYIIDATVQTEGRPSGPTGIADPFTALKVGEYGAEVGVRVDDIAEEFVNEDLELVRVYVDEKRNLRRVDTDAFVRNVVDDASTDVEMIKGMLGDVPPDANGADQLASALFHEAIPSSFVRLDDPDDENVVTRVMDLDVETNKYNLLLSLGATASGDGFTDDDLETMEQALAKLSGLEDVDGVERLIEERLL